MNLVLLVDEGRIPSTVHRQWVLVPRVCPYWLGRICYPLVELQLLYGVARPRSVLFHSHGPGGIRAGIRSNIATVTPIRDLPPGDETVVGTVSINHDFN